MQQHDSKTHDSSELTRIICAVAWLTAVTVTGSLGVTTVVVYWATGAMPEAMALFVAAITPGLIVPGAAFVNTSLQYKLEAANAELLEVNEKLQALSETDALTEIPNRRKFAEVAERELALAARHGYSSSVVLVDFDDFKKVNDRYGHTMGDQVLVQSVAVMQAVIRSSDVLARFGGEEFILLLPHTSGEGAYSLTERLRQAVASLKVAVDGVSASVTVSAGIVTCTTSTTKLEHMVSVADELLYESKGAGRNRCTARTLDAVASLRKDQLTTRTVRAAMGLHSV